MERHTKTVGPQDDTLPRLSQIASMEMHLGLKHMCGCIFLFKTWINFERMKIFIHLSYLLLICGHRFSRALTPIPIIWTIRNFSISIWAGREDREDHEKLMDFWFPIIRETHPSERHSLFHSYVFVLRFARNSLELFTVLIFRYSFWTSRKFLEICVPEIFYKYFSNR